MAHPQIIVHPVSSRSHPVSSRFHSVVIPFTPPDTVLIPSHPGLIPSSSRPNPGLITVHEFLDQKVAVSIEITQNLDYKCLQVDEVHCVDERSTKPHRKSPYVAILVVSAVQILKLVSESKVAITRTGWTEMGTRWTEIRTRDEQ